MAQTKTRSEEVRKIIKALLEAGDASAAASSTGNPAELNKAEGNKAECLDNSRKSLILFEFVDKEQKTYSADRILKMDSIKSRIEAF